MQRERKGGVVVGANKQMLKHYTKLKLFVKLKEHNNLKWWCYLLFVSFVGVKKMDANDLHWKVYKFKKNLKAYGKTQVSFFLETT